MKKILAALCFSFLSLNFAHSEVLSLGVSGSIGMLSATGTEKVSGTGETQVIWGATSAAAATTAAATAQTSQKGSEDLFIGYISLFGEVHLFDSGLRLGGSYVPYPLESETTDNVRNDNCGLRDTGNAGIDHSSLCKETKNKVQVDLQDLVTMYVSYHHDISAPFIDGFFIKAGYIQADVITNEKLTSGSQYANTSLDGEFFGLGIEKNLSEGLFVRAEGTVTQFDNIKLVNANSDNTNEISITGLDGATATISIGKTF
tara:strand:- start:1439 stop:2215 length:777 start_codon:yes stop_codon:yes gene_type:complete